MVIFSTVMLVYQRASMKIYGDFMGVDPQVCMTAKIFVWDGDNSPWWFHEDFTEIHDEHIWLVVFRPTPLKNHGWWVTVGMKFDEIPNMEK